MSEPKQSSSNVSAGAVWILLAAAGTYFVVHTAPLEGNRPPTTEVVVRQQPNRQDIESRLWWDPFAAVAERLAKSSDLKPENCGKPEIGDHCVSPLMPANESPNPTPAIGEGDPSKPQPPIVIVASVSGAPYSEDHESRRRQRYAIVAGLARQGFAPSDPEHLGFFWPRALGKLSDAKSEVVSSERMPEVVPFEWFESKDKKSSALLLWLDEDVLGGSPLKGFDAFFCRTLRTGLPSSFRWSRAVVLGPESSTTLKAMASELGGTWRSKGCSEEQQRAEFYVFSATAADAEIIPNRPVAELDCPGTGDRSSEVFLGDGIKLYRMTATDAALACLIRDELALRDPHWAAEHLPRVLTNFLSYVKEAIPESLKGALGFVDDSDQNHIVFISEWDTFYGQSLPRAMANCLGPMTGSKCNKLDEKFVHRYSYLRGLDGQAPNLQEANSGNASKETDKSQDASDDSKDKGKERAKTGPNAKPSDRAEGQGQFDYLRRLGEEIARFDAHLRSGIDEKPENRNRNGIFAVGVLGSDRYDKLLILQALRPLLPNARFFTTDLEAMVLHPSALPQTRNLLIASSFSLQLDRGFQGEIPPFRSSYQTAAFFATQAAVRGAVEGCFDRVEREAKAVGPSICIWKEPSPLLFEVGLSTLFQLPFAKNGNESGPPPTNAHERKRAGALSVPLGPADIHPKASDMFPQPARGIPLAAAMAIVIIGIGITLTCRFMRRKIWVALDGHLARPNGRTTLFAIGGAVFLGLGLLVVLLAWAIFSWWPPVARLLTDTGQPMLWLEGISIWPTIVLRSAILVICLLLLSHCRRWLNEDFWDLAHEMRMTSAWKKVVTAEKRIASTKSPWIRLVSFFDYRMSDDDRSASEDKDEDKSLSPYLMRFWGEYIYQSRSRARIIRVVVYVVVVFILWGILELVFGNPPIPTRGMWALGLYTPVTWMLNVATLFLTLFVADATYL
jgi:hypothetical protein